MRGRGLSIGAAIAAVALWSAPLAWAGSWQSFSISEVDGGTTIAKASGSFYSSYVDNKLEFRGRLTVKSGECGYVKFGYQNPKPWDDVSGSEHWFDAKPRVCGGTVEFDTARWTMYGNEVAFVKVCQEVWGWDDCETRTLVVAP